jgi:putative endonuclease
MKPPAGQRRLQAGGFGRRAEWLAALLLTLKGYRLLARNYVVQGGEIDLIARRGDTLVFVEVKARPRIEEALVAISATKRRRIERAARVWLAHHPWAARLVLRGDGIFIAPRRLPRHIEDAYPLNLA